jgi:hypothetical protein
MLWSVVVCDLLFKLQNLVDLYSDDRAKAILAEVSKLQKVLDLYAAPYDPSSQSS